MSRKSCQDAGGIKEERQFDRGFRWIGISGENFPGKFHYLSGYFFTGEDDPPDESRGFGFRSYKRTIHEHLVPRGMNNRISKRRERPWPTVLNSQPCMRVTSSFPAPGYSFGIIRPQFYTRDRQSLMY